jgi:hypothetical protein
MNSSLLPGYQKGVIYFECFWRLKVEIYPHGGNSPNILLYAPF